MTKRKKRSFTGPPPPVLDLTLEQQFKVIQIKNLLEMDNVSKEDIIPLFLDLQRTTLRLSNTVTQLIKEWPTRPLITHEEELKSGTSSETKD